MLSNHPQTAVFLGSAIKNNAQPNKAEHYLSVCAQLKGRLWPKRNLCFYRSELITLVVTLNEYDLTIDYVWLLFLTN